jgi:hypothetical protein
VPIETVIAQGWEKEFPPELFQKIFLYLAPRERANLPLVCRTFKQVIVTLNVATIKGQRNPLESLLSRTSERYKSA